MSYTTAYLGVDPGQSGGFAIITPGHDPYVVKMPETEKDIWDALAAFRIWHDSPVICALEAVHSMPGQGVASSFKFGKGYGGLRMALIGLGIPFRDVRPQAWQKALGCLSGGDKRVTRSMAQQLFPSIKVTHAIADALLIAKWLSQQP